MFLPSRIGELVKYAGQLIIQFALFSLFRLDCAVYSFSFSRSLSLSLVLVLAVSFLLIPFSACMLFIRCLLISFTFQRFTSLSDAKASSRSLLCHCNKDPIPFYSFAHLFVRLFARSVVDSGIQFSWICVCVSLFFLFFLEHCLHLSFVIQIANLVPRWSVKHMAIWPGESKLEHI